MSANYHVCFLGAGVGRYGPPLRESLATRLRELGIDPDSEVGWLETKTVHERSGAVPFVAVYFGNAREAHVDSGVVMELRGESAVVLPVVEELTQYTSSVPAVLHLINGSELNGSETKLSEIANVVLENLSLLRRSRRLFISYRRKESAVIALQLKHELEAKGFDVFLDTHSVRPGEDFQEVLWERLADSDVVVLLDSPGFLERRWTREELAQASAMTVGLLQVIWPDTKPVPYSDLCVREYTTTGDFEEDGTLSTDKVRAIVDGVERLRARSLAARHNNLVREFCDAAARESIDACVQPDRVITARSRSGNIVAIPAIGRPDALLYHSASTRYKKQCSDGEAVYLLYDHRGLRDNWMGFLVWLDGFLPVKTLQVTTVGERLRQ